MNLLIDTLKVIREVDKDFIEASKNKWDGLVKPLGSLGALEEIGAKVAGITRNLNFKLDKKAVVVFASDNGVLEEGVSTAPKEFTTLLTQAMANKITGVATLNKFYGVDTITVDIGLDSNFRDERVIYKRISNGTKNFTKEPAMSYIQAVKSIEVGIEIGDKLASEGYKILGAGELGMGNTTTSAAVLKVFSDFPIDLICGKGAGLTDDQCKDKKNTILKGIRINKPNKNNPIEVLSKVGGYDIGAMCGLYLSAAKNHIPIVIDGFISSAAALLAVRLNPLVKDYIIPSHLSDEPGSKYMFEELELEPILNLKMRLGEGSACPIAFNIIEASIFTQNNMGTFEEATVDGSVLLDMREE